MADTLLSVLPVEVFERLAMNVGYGEGVALQRIPPVRALMETASYWRARRLHIKSREALRRILDDDCTKGAQIINLSMADIDDTDLAFISQHFVFIRKICLDNNPDLTDYGIQRLLVAHGAHLETLRLGRLFRLTNCSLESIKQNCRRLRCLSLTGGMYSAAALRSMLSEGLFRLRSLSISRCHLVDTRELPALGGALGKLCRLDVSYLDGLQPYQLQPILRECPRLQRINLEGCHELTLKSIRELAAIRPDLHIVHNAQLEDHSIDGIRRFLLGLIAS